MTILGTRWRTAHPLARLLAAQEIIERAGRRDPQTSVGTGHDPADDALREARRARLEAAAELLGPGEDQTTSEVLAQLLDVSPHEITMLIDQARAAGLLGQPARRIDPDRSRRPRP